jgi:hypothetical protein
VAFLVGAIMTGDPSIDALLALIPAGYLKWFSAAVTISSLIAPFLKPPPPMNRLVWDVPSGGWWADARALTPQVLKNGFLLTWRAIYEIITLLAIAKGYVKPAYQPGRTATMVPTDQRGPVRDLVAATLQIPREQTKP